MTYAQYIVLPTLLLIVIGLATNFATHSRAEYRQVSITEARYVTDFSDEKKLVGASHNVFVGTVKRVIGTKDLGVGPETQFEVEVVENIKGKLEGVVTVNQLGGWIDNVLYTVSGDVTLNSSEYDGYLLNTGSTYIFATRFNENQNWHTLNPHVSAKKMLSADKNLNLEQLKEIVKNDNHANALKAAYPNEELLEVDVANNNDRNSYKAASESKAADQTDSAQQAPEEVAVEANDSTQTEEQ